MELTELQSGSQQQLKSHNPCIKLQWHVSMKLLPALVE
jgi:hypothetical protein